MPRDIKSEEDFDAEIQRGVPTLVDFWAPWCSHCEALAPLLDELDGDLGDKVNIVKVSVDDVPFIFVKHQVLAVPTLLFFKFGVKVGQSVGLSSKEDILSQIEEDLT